VPLGTVLPAMLGVHAVIAVGEAVITVAAVSAVLATRPDLIRGPVPAPEGSILTTPVTT
jgi:cobalt/nickel transport system permease protein